ncbi:MAG: ribonuclease HII [Weeksellaceae bacterium]|jgi:ribonuclease HII|nr:ribonuclease HII [Weeksellaceae bacterium]MDX9705428.1 ribonuclease HII [Weeksellaceae bacterium]
MKLQFNHNKTEAGCDEAGRGCLAGPVVAAAVILKKDFDNDWITDSKQLSEKKRKIARIYIEENALAWSVAYINPEKIDEINILNASILAMHLALDGLKIVPEFIAVDGNRFKNYKDIPHNCVVKGDAKYKNIAAASILAKTYRDDWMEKLHEEFPYYNWKKNKGYPTKEHREGIRLHGACLHHRNSFRLLPSQLELDFTKTYFEQSSQLPK